MKFLSLIQEMQRIINKMLTSKTEINQHYTEYNSDAGKAKYKTNISLCINDG